MDILLIISRLKQAFFLKNDAELASFLNISHQTLSNWKARSTIDWPLVFTKCETISLDWLITGKGEMFISDKPPDKGPVACAMCNVKDQLIKSQQQTIELLQDKLAMLMKEECPDEAECRKNEKRAG